MFVEFDTPIGVNHVVNADHVLYAYVDPGQLGIVKLVMQVIPVVTPMGKMTISTFSIEVKGTLTEVQCALKGQPILDLRH